MSSEKLKELHEGAEHAEHDRSMVPVTLTMAILAVFVAAVSLLGHRAHTEEVILQDEVTDGWGYYQAKTIRRNTDQMFVDLVSMVPSTDSALASKLRARYETDIKRYTGDQKEIETKTKKLESETAHEKKRADLYDLGEVLVEVALVITSITLLSKQRIFWFSGMIIGIAGLVVAAIGIFAL
jgi:hypothetical protein